MMPTIRLVSTAFILLSSSTFAANSLCTAQEKIIFNCSTGSKLISVCASPDLAEKTGYLQYRFGPQGKPELAIPDFKTTPKKGIHTKTIGYSGGGAAYIRFMNGDTGYVVYTGEGKGWKKNGVAVENKGKFVRFVSCKKAVTSELGPDLFEKSGLPEDPNEFELP